MLDKLSIDKIAPQMLKSYFWPLFKAIDGTVTYYNRHN